MDVLLDVLRQNPELAFFLTLGGGYLVGGLKLGSQPIGAVLGVLLVGLVVGQLGVSIADEVNWMLFYLFALGFTSLAVAALPHFVTLLIGRHVFRVQPGILLGIFSGPGTSAPGLAAVQESAESKTPTLGYGVTYALGNILLGLGGSMIVLLLTA